MVWCDIENARIKGNYAPKKYKDRIAALVFNQWLMLLNKENGLLELMNKCVDVVVANIIMRH